MKQTVFLSYPRPFTERQEQFLLELMEELSIRGYQVCTYWGNEVHYNLILSGIHEVLCGCQGMIVVALRRTYLKEAMKYHRTDHHQIESTNIINRWLTSTWCQIEAGMAYERGLPTIYIKESGLIRDGLLDSSEDNLMYEVDLERKSRTVFESVQWNHMMEEWDLKMKQIYSAGVK